MESTNVNYKTIVQIPGLLLDSKPTLDDFIVADPDNTYVYSYCVAQDTNIVYVKSGESFRLQWVALGQLQDTNLFLIVPEDYKPLYQRILHLLVEYGEEMLKDCKATCKDRNVNIIDCYNTFLSLLAANAEGKDTLAEALKAHIEYKLDFYFGNK